MSTVTAPPRSTAAAPGPSSRAMALQPIKWRTPILYGAIAALSLVFFGLLPAGGKTTAFTFSTGTDFFAIDPVAVHSKTTAIALTVLALACAVVSFLATRSRRHVWPWLPIVFGLAEVFAFLTWAVADKVHPLPVTGLLAGSLFLATPLVFGSLS